MKKDNLISRIVLFAFSLFVIALGVALITRANLGTSPAACPPYVLSLVPGAAFTMGTYLCCMQIMFVLTQIAILRKDFQLFQLFQLAASFLFGFYTDLAMAMTVWLPTDNYLSCWLLLVAGCAVMGAALFWKSRPLCCFCREKALSPQSVKSAIGISILSRFSTTSF